MNYFDTYLYFDDNGIIQTDKDLSVHTMFTVQRALSSPVANLINILRS